MRKETAPGTPNNARRTPERFRTGQGAGATFTSRREGWSVGRRAPRAACTPGESFTPPVPWEKLVSCNTSLFPQEVLSTKACPVLHWLREPSATGPAPASDGHLLLPASREPSPHRRSPPISCTREDRTGGGLQSMAPFPALPPSSGPSPGCSGHEMVRKRNSCDHTHQFPCLAPALGNPPAKGRPERRTHSSASDSRAL